MDAAEQLVLPKMRRRRPNPPTGDDLKRAGIERALLNERAQWRLKALKIIMAVAEMNMRFTADDIQAAAKRAGLGPPHHPNVIGAVIRIALLAGIMTKTGRYVKGKRAAQHGRMIAEYRRVEAK